MFRKMVIILLIPFLCFLSEWAPYKLHGFANTPDMNKYIERFNEFKAGGSISNEEKVKLDSMEERFKEDASSDQYALRAVFLDYFFIPLLILLFSIFWMLLGGVISLESVSFKVIAGVVASALLFSLSLSFSMVYFLIYFCMLMFGLFVFPKLILKQCKTMRGRPE